MAPRQKPTRPATPRRAPPKPPSAKARVAKAKIGKTKSAKVKSSKVKSTKVKSGAAKPSRFAPDPIDALIDAAAAILTLTIEPAWKPAVRANLQVIFAQVALVTAFDLPDDAEPAPIFRA